MTPLSELASPRPFLRGRRAPVRPRGFATRCRGARARPGAPGCRRPSPPACGHTRPASRPRTCPPGRRRRPHGASRGARGRWRLSGSRAPGAKRPAFEFQGREDADVSRDPGGLAEPEAVRRSSGAQVMFSALAALLEAGQTAEAAEESPLPPEVALSEVGCTP